MGGGRASRFLVIGAGGLVGRHIRAALGDRDAVYTYRRDAPSGALELDIADHDVARRIVREVTPGVVILAAADAYVERCEREPDATRRINVDAAAEIAGAARSVGGRIVVFSSEYVFDGGAGDYDEGDERHPINEYGRQKVALEDIALKDGRGLVCRTSAVFGSEPSRKNFVCQLVDQLRAGRTFDVPSDQVVTPTYAPSLAWAVLRLIEHEATGIFHVAGPTIMGRFAFATAAAKAYGLDPALLRPRATSELKLAAARPARAGLRTDKLRLALGSALTEPVLALRELAADQGVGTPS